MRRAFRVREIATYLYESVHRHNGHVRLGFCVIHQIQIDELLQFEVVGLHAVDYVWEQRGYIFANGHRSDNLRIKSLTSFRREVLCTHLFYGLFLLFLLVIV